MKIYYCETTGEREIGEKRSGKMQRAKSHLPAKFFGQHRKPAKLIELSLGEKKVGGGWAKFKGDGGRSRDVRSFSRGPV